MAKDQNDKSTGIQSWWQTMPGILTAIAAMMTATTGLLIALNQVGCFDKNTKNNEIVSTEKNTTGNSQENKIVDANKNTNSRSSENKNFPKNITNPHDVNFEGNVYKFATTQLNYYSPNSSELKFKIRITSNENGVYFSSDFFRLLINDLKLSPETSAAEWMAGFSTKEGEVTFIIPDTTSSVQLMIGDVHKGEEGALKIQFNLK